MLRSIARPLRGARRYTVNAAGGAGVPPTPPPASGGGNTGLLVAGALVAAGVAGYMAFKKDAPSVTATKAKMNLKDPARVERIVQREHEATSEGTTSME